jgi:hypothetical protein
LLFLHKIGAEIINNLFLAAIRLRIVHLVKLLADIKLILNSLSLLLLFNPLLDEVKC